MTWEATTLSTGLTIKKFERDIVTLSEIYSGLGTITTPVASPYQCSLSSSEDYTDLNVGDLLTLTSSTCYVLSKDGSNKITVSNTVQTGLLAGKFTYQTWQEKITLAKVMIQSQLENYLSSNGYKVDEDSGDNLIDLIANPDIFAYASDFLTLNLIYSDLELGGSVMEIFDKKKMFYYDRYQDEMNVKLKQINIDSDLDGDADQYRVTIAKISRLTR